MCEFCDYQNIPENGKQLSMKIDFHREGILCPAQGVFRCSLVLSDLLLSFSLQYLGSAFAKSQQLLSEDLDAKAHATCQACKYSIAKVLYQVIGSVMFVASLSLVQHSALVYL